MIDLFGTEELLTIVARAWTLVWKTEAQVFASSGNENGAIQRLAEGSFVAERAIADGNEALVCKTLGVKILAQFAQHVHKGRREIMSLFCLAVSGLLFSGRIFAWLAHWGNFCKTDRQAAR